MFKKKCSRCERKIEKTHSFCPFCGKNLKSKNDEEDFGFLGKSDFINQDNAMSTIGGDSFMDKMIKNAMKMIEQQMKDTCKKPVTAYPGSAYDLSDLSLRPDLKKHR